MFFYEWVVPMMAALGVAGFLFYITVKNKTNAGIRTEGRVVFHKPDPDESTRSSE